MIAQRIGVERARHFIDNWRQLVIVLTRGELRPGHVKRSSEGRSARRSALPRPDAPPNAATFRSIPRLFSQGVGLMHGETVSTIDSRASGLRHFVHSSGSYNVPSSFKCQRVARVEKVAPWK